MLASFELSPKSGNPSVHPSRENGDENEAEDRGEDERVVHDSY